MLDSLNSVPTRIRGEFGQSVGDTVERPLERSEMPVLAVAQVGRLIGTGYRFHVAAMAAGGSRSSEAVWDFSIAPSFYQTYWFYTTCAVALSFALFGTWQVRVAGVRRRLRIVFEERMRIGQELHDTLLQSLVGVSMQFEDLSKTIDSSPSTAKEKLQRLQQYVKFYIRETRESVQDLRTPEQDGTNLHATLREVAERLTAGQPAHLVFQVGGTPRPCSPPVKGHLLRLAQEAVSNAVR